MEKVSGDWVYFSCIRINEMPLGVHKGIEELRNQHFRSACENVFKTASREIILM